jgi:hypothetical protein
LLTNAGRASTGTLYLADIGVPPQLYAEPGLGLRVESLFSGSDIRHIKDGSDPSAANHAIVGSTDELTE